MNDKQKTIRIFAISLGIFLVIAIFCFIFFMITSVFNLFDDNLLETNKYFELNNNYKITNLDIELGYTNLIIKLGDEVKCETNNSDITIKENNGRLIVREKSKKIFKDKEDYKVIIYVPKDEVFEEVNLEEGAGKMEIEKLSTNILDLEFGAGVASINELNVFYDAEIKGGTGKFELLNGDINNFDLDMGVGKMDITSKVSGTSSIDAGIGELDFNILGSRDDYRVKADGGIGSVYLNNEKITKNKYYGSGANYIEIDGGIGKINLNFNN